MMFLGSFVLSVLFCFSLPLHRSEAVPADEASKEDRSITATSLLARNPLGEDNLWPDAYVPYEFSAVYSEDMRQQVHAAMGDMQRLTCVRWVPRERHHENYVEFVVGDGCYSEVGRNWQGPQELSLNPSQGCLHRSVVVHELMHAIGFGHEQNRWDRDDYVIVHENRIDPTMIGNFRKSPRPSATGWEQFSYEIGSVMHYAGNFFGIGLGDTMEPRVSGTKMGNTVGMTEMDVKQINFLYKCDGDGIRSDNKTGVGEKVGDTMPSADEVRRNVTLHISVWEKVAGSAATNGASLPLLPSSPAPYCCVLAVVGWTAFHQPNS